MAFTRDDKALLDGIRNPSVINPEKSACRQDLTLDCLSCAVSQVNAVCGLSR